MNEELQELLGDFVLEAQDRLDRIEDGFLGLEAGSRQEREAVLEEVRRELHTLKGNSGMMGLADLQELAHALEDRVERIDPAEPRLAPLLEDVDRFRELLAQAAGSSTTGETAADGGGAGLDERRSTRVALEALDRLHAGTAELVVARHTLADRLYGVAKRIPDEARREEDFAAAWRRLDDARRELDAILESLQHQIQALRMVPLQPIFDRLQRLVHDEAAEQGKTVHLKTSGGETPLDTALTDLASDTLGHIVRNAVVHGIEAADDRRAAGKPDAGSVLIQAALKEGSVVIDVYDDGAGIDEAGLRAAAKRAGIDTAQLQDVHALLFHQGLSTREDADRSSGRGVGMAAVLTAVHGRGGDIEVATVPGMGSCFSLRLPLTVAITNALLVETGGEHFAVPVAAIRETGPDAPALAGSPDSPGSTDVGKPDDALHLGSYLGLVRGGGRSDRRSGGRSAPEYFVTVEADGRRRRVLVDALGELQEIVVRPLDGVLGRPKGIAGSTVLGNGRVVLILDPPQLTSTSAAPNTGTPGTEIH